MGDGAGAGVGVGAGRRRSRDWSSRSRSLELKLVLRLYRVCTGAVGAGVLLGLSGLGAVLCFAITACLSFLGPWIFSGWQLFGGSSPFGIAGSIPPVSSSPAR